MDTHKIIQITSGRGPAECCLAVALALKELLDEARGLSLEVEVIERIAGPGNGTLHSATVKVSGKKAQELAASWEGTLLWICQSPYRIYHGRKNWFIGINVFDSTQTITVDEADIIYHTMRSSGPGGQHVNKTESAVRATHTPSGISVTVRESRSQMQNRKLALQRITEKVQLWQMEQASANAKAVWQNHNELERGNPKRTYKDRKFTRVKK